MNWSAIGAIAEAAGALGTIIGLFFVYIQLKNLTQNQYANTVQNIASGERDIWQTVLDDQSMTQIAVNHIGFSKETLDEMGIEARNIIQLVLFMRQYENIYYQHLHGMLPPKLWTQWRISMVFTFSDERVQKILSRSRIGFSKEFRKFVQDDIIPETKSIVD